MMDTTATRNAALKRIQGLVYTCMHKPGYANVAFGYMDVAARKYPTLADWIGKQKEALMAHYQAAGCSWIVHV